MSSSTTPSPSGMEHIIYRTTGRHAGVTLNGVPGPSAAIDARLAELEQEAAQLRALVADLYDDSPCAHFDHHGYCQPHGLFETDPACPHQRARQILAEHPLDGVGVREMT